MPAPFLSVLIDDCIANGRDYNAGGARYNNSYIQGVGIGTVTDSLAALRALVFESPPDRARRAARRPRCRFRRPRAAARAAPAQGAEVRQRRRGRRRADARRLRGLLPGGRWADRHARGGRYRIQMLPTTCHVYFGSVTGATPDGRHAGLPLSEGISPVQGADRKGPDRGAALGRRSWTTCGPAGRSST